MACKNIDVVASCAPEIRANKCWGRASEMAAASGGGGWLRDKMSWRVSRKRRRRRRSSRRRPSRRRREREENVGDECEGQSTTRWGSARMQPGALGEPGAWRKESSPIRARVYKQTLRGSRDVEKNGDTSRRLPCLLLFPRPRRESPESSSSPVAARRARIPLSR